MLRLFAPAFALVAVFLVATTTGPTSDVSLNDLYVYSVIADLVCWTRVHGR